ncbi:HET-domain-containing protein [Apiospora sp. TS-2023a]
MVSSQLKRTSDSPFRNMINGRMYPISPRDPKAIRKINHWLEGATEKESCASASNQLPSRLLRIEFEGTSIALITASDKRAKYTALSHCWGSSQPKTLTKSSFSELKEGVETAFLPQSFQDAIWITHRLGFQYLWIDSLCIFQDSQKDWLHESSKMRDVYENAWLTIAASRASNSEQGFLEDQEHYANVSVPYQEGGTSGEIMACIVPIEIAENPQRRVELDEEPLTTRGWALQERYISRRTLHFSRSQVLFEYNDKVFTQDSRDHSSLRSYTPASGIDHDNWYTLVGKYSARKLTRDSDKLPALAGLAAYFAAHLSKGKDSAYVAGLWREDMLAGLCWERRDDDSTQGTSPKSYRAPSWSWAATDGLIQYSFSHELGGVSNLELAIVDDAHASLISTDSPFGEVRGGWARLRVILLWPYTMRNDPIIKTFFFRENGANFDIDAFWDIDSRHKAANVFGGPPLRFIPLIYTVEEGIRQYWVFFLMVEQAKHEVCQHSDLQGYRRVGAGIAFPEFRNLGAIKLAKGKWTEMFQAGKLEDIILI